MGFDIFMKTYMNFKVSYVYRHILKGHAVYNVWSAQKDI